MNLFFTPKTQRSLSISLIFLVTILFAQNGDVETYNYIVNYFMMPSLHMTMEIQQNYPESSENQIDVYTKTKSFFDKIFAINNHYQTIYSNENSTVIFSKKDINQPNVQQSLEIDYNNSPIQYSNDNTRDKANEIYDFFSMLMFLRTVPKDSLDKIKILVDMEGEFFEATFQAEAEENIKVGKEKILTDRIRINYVKLDENQVSVLDYTDIFYWKIASEDGNKYIWLEQNNKRRIIKAKFSEGNSWLEAKLIEGK